MDRAAPCNAGRRRHSTAHRRCDPRDAARKQLLLSALDVLNAFITVICFRDELASHFCFALTYRYIENAQGIQTFAR
jgi:hypothetical protein